MAKDDEDFDLEISGEGAADQVEERDEDDTEEPEDTVESLRERLAKADAALKKANKESERRRRAAKATEAEEPKVSAESDDRSHDRAVRAAGRAALREAGFTGSAERAKRLLRLIDTREVEFDDDDDPMGLDAQIDELKDDFPELFRSAEATAVQVQPRVRTGRVDASAGGGRQKTSVRTASDLIAEGLRGNRGRR